MCSSCNRAAPFGMLDDLFVHPAWRGRGVARRLIEAAMEHLGFPAIGQLMSTDLQARNALNRGPCLAEKVAYND